jgi:GGDEF domain-containing protein
VTRTHDAGQKLRTLIDDPALDHITPDRKWSALATVVAACLGVVAASLINLGRWYLGGDASLQPYFNWCGILFVATWGGLRGGLLVAALSIAAQSVMLATLPGAGPLIYERIVPESIVSILIAVIAGEAWERRRKRETVFGAWSEQISEVVRDLETRNARAAEVIGELGRRVADQTLTVATLDKVARRLEVFDENEVLHALLDVLHLCLPAEAASVYLLRDGQLAPRVHIPPAQPAPSADQVMADPLVKQVLSTGKPRHVRDGPAEHGVDRALPPTVLMAAPLLSPTGAIAGLVTIERMPFLSLSASTARLFQIVVGWGARGLQNAALFEHTSARHGEDDAELGLSFPQTMRRVWHEIVRVQRYNHPLSMLVVRIDDSARVPPEQALAVRRLIARTLTSALRPTDVLGQHRLEDRFICLLPETSSGAAKAVAARIVQATRALADQPAVGGRHIAITCGSASLSYDTSSAAGLLAAADEAVNVLSPTHHGGVVLR